MDGRDYCDEDPWRAVQAAADQNSGKARAVVDAAVRYCSFAAFTKQAWCADAVSQAWGELLDAVAVFRRSTRGTL
jgi:hypothetical protein